MNGDDKPMCLPEDVYYVTRDEASAYGLNQLQCVPAVSDIELQAIMNMCDRSAGTMGLRTAQEAAPLGEGMLANLVGHRHGLYYADGLGRLWRISEERQRPDLDVTQMDFAKAVVTSGEEHLRKLRRETTCR